MLLFLLLVLEFAGVSTTTLSASSTLNVVGASNFGPADNATISAAGAGTFAGVASTTLSASSTLNVVGVSNFGPGNLASISAAGVISGSGDSTIHKITMDRLVAATADINGGSLDDVTIGGSTPAAGTFTNISGSGTLCAAGIVTVGNGKLTVSKGVLSGSATATLANATFDRFTVASADINGGAIDGTNIGASAQGTGEFTTLSASSTLNVAGASNFGPDNLQVSAQLVSCLVLVFKRSTELPLIDLQLMDLFQVLVGLRLQSNLLSVMVNLPLVTKVFFLLLLLQLSIAWLLIELQLMEVLQ